MTLFASDDDDRAQQLIALTDRLTKRLLEETQAFESRKPQTVAGRTEETLRLANVYRHESLRIRQNPALLQGCKPELKQRLVQGTIAFQTVLARHGRALKAAKTLTEGLVQAIANEVSAQRTRNAGYGPTARTVAGDASAITLNRRA
jgi:hypothetical protein